MGQTGLNKTPRGIFGFIRKLFTLLVISTLLLGGTGYWVYNQNLKPLPKSEVEAVNFTIPSGASTVQIAQTLEEKGLIRNALVLRVFARLNGLDGQLKAGEYSIETGMSVSQILDKLTQGSNEYFSFTIPEGYTIEQIADRLEEEKLIDRDTFMNQVANGDFEYKFLEGLPRDNKRLEGYLFPDTYKVTRRTTEEQIIKMMLDRFAEVVTPEYIQKAEKLGLSVHQAVTLASVIEREAKIDKERPKVAAVFLNRIKKGWKLQSCATVQYALGEQKERLLDKDLQIDSPYNTYKIVGLPPGPIASPGEASLLAAVNPADVDYLFFVVSEEGKHVFSRTLSEHNRAKARYIESNFK